jgi:hypothetical protein
MKALSLTIQKIWPMLKFLQADRQTGQKLYAPDLSIRGHKNSHACILRTENCPVKVLELTCLFSGHACTYIIFNFMSILHAEQALFTLQNFLKSKSFNSSKTYLTRTRYKPGMHTFTFIHWCVCPIEIKSRHCESCKVLYGFI